MNDLNDFFRDEVSWEPVLGTYLHPYCLLSEPKWDDPLSVTEVIHTCQVEDEEILITRLGGLFIRPPLELLHANDPKADLRGRFEEKQQFEEYAANLFNLLICEYAFHEVVSEPATPVHISAGKLIDDHALVISGGGGREIYLERTMNPATHLLQGTWRSHRLHDHRVTVEASKLSCASKLREISEILPALAAGAYSLFSRRQVSEALIDGWIVVEQIVDWLWDKYRSELADSDRRRRLSDRRTYTAGIQIEVLHTARILDHDLYQALTRARHHRNDLAHRAKISFDMSHETLLAMKAAVEFLCEAPIGLPAANTVLNW